MGRVCIAPFPNISGPPQSSKGHLEIMLEDTQQHLVKRLTTGIERTVVSVELVTEYEFPSLPVHVVRLCPEFHWRLAVDEAPVAWHIGNLACCIGAT